MAIKTAITRYNNEFLEVQAETFMTHHLFNVIKDSLKCPTDGCDCTLIFTNAHYGPIFRKYPKMMHDPNCIYFEEPRGTRSSVLSGEEIESVLPDDYIHKKNQRAGKKFIDSLKDIKKPDRKPKKSKNPKKVADDSNGVVTPTIRVVDNGPDIFVEGGKKVRKPSFKEFNFNTIQDIPLNTIIHYNGILKVNYNNDKNQYKLISPLNDTKSSLEIILTEAYFVSSNLNNLNNIAKSLFKAIGNNDNFYFSSLGSMTKEGNMYKFIITNYAWFEILYDGKKIVTRKPDTMMSYLVKNRIILNN